MNPGFIDHLSAAIRDATRCPFTLRNFLPIGGGSISETYRLEGTDGSRYFLKVNDIQHLPMFVAEAVGLDAIAGTKSIRVPNAIAHGTAGMQSYQLLEYLELRSHGNAKRLGEQIAALHRCTAPHFGFPQDNFIGTTPQPNDWADDWVAFWRDQRLGFQLRLAAQNGCSGQLRRLGERLIDALPIFFAGYTPQPSLLHGDLWSGNHAFLVDSTPAIFDPATYYGDRECDIAMTELFGGYAADFYTAYRAAYPLDEGYAIRRDVYNLYQVLNHTNLFGASYARQAEQLMQKLLAQGGR